MKYNPKTLAAITVLVATPFAGIASASTKHNPCGIDKPGHEKHKKHKKHDHDHDKSKVKCDCTSIWETINSVIKRLEVLEAKPAVSGSPGTIGPEGPAGPAGPRGLTGPKGAKGAPGKTTNYKLVFQPFTIAGMKCQQFAGPPRKGKIVISTVCIPKTAKVIVLAGKTKR